MNKIIILGTLVRDCELKYTQSGTAVGSFGIAYNEKVKDQSGQYTDKAHFFDVTAWGKTAENVQKFFQKGSRILINGQLQFSQWEKDGQKRSKVDIRMHSFDFIDRKSGNPSQSNDNSQNNNSYSQANTNTPPPTQNHSQNQQGAIPDIDLSSDIPFDSMNGALYNV